MRYLTIALVLGFCSIVTACDPLAVCALKQQVVVQQVYAAPVVQYEVQAVQVQPVYAVPQYAPVYAARLEVQYAPQRDVAVQDSPRFPVLAAINAGRQNRLQSRQALLR